MGGVVLLCEEGVDLVEKSAVEGDDKGSTGAEGAKEGKVC